MSDELIGTCTICGRGVYDNQSYAKSRHKHGDVHHISCEQRVGEEDLPQDASQPERQPTK